MVKFSLTWQVLFVTKVKKQSIVIKNLLFFLNGGRITGVITGGKGGFWVFIPWNQGVPVGTAFLPEEENS